MQTTVTVPEWVFQAHTWVVHNYTTVIGVLVIGTLASITVALINRKKYTRSSEEALAKHVIAWLMVVFTTLFTWLAYLLFYAQTHTSFVSSLPLIGSHTAEAIGWGYTIYNLRLNKYFLAFATWATKETSKVEEEIPTVSPPVEPDQPEVPANFAG